MASTERLETYLRKRDFRRTSEPKGGAREGKGFSFVVQKHFARRTHFDFRLELDGVLKSWAVAKGPSLDSAEKRLAVRTEDHPLEYGEFEGTIPHGQYGGGEVMLWDRGRWVPKEDPHAGIESGKLKFELEGERLRGGFTLVRMRQSGKRGSRENWLLIKERDETASDAVDPVARYVTSVASGRTRECIAATDDVWISESNGDSGATGRDVPRFIEPQLATLVDATPRGDGWLFELKIDGYRLLAAKAGWNVRLYTRGGQDWTARFPRIARAVAKLRPTRLLIDGEVAVFDAAGRTSFAALQQVVERGDDTTSYVAFDLLDLEGKDLRDQPQLVRKERLRLLLDAVPTGTPLRYSDHMLDAGEVLYAEACRHGVEGIIAKRSDATYRSGRSRRWLKIKCGRREEFVIRGYRRSEVRDRPFASLLLGSHEPEGLVYRGRVGTGFDAASMKRLAARFVPLERGRSPFTKVSAEGRRGGVWLEPSLVAEIAFREFTGDGHVRHASFQGLREDKPASEVSVGTVGVGKEGGDASPDTDRRGGLPKAFAEVRLTSPDKVLFPRQGLTKGDLLDYYGAVCSWIMPHLERRPISLVRCPEGRQRACFFQRHRTAGMPDAIRTVDLPEKGGDEKPYLYLDGPAGLAAIVQLGVLELHGWGSRTDRLDRPDRIVFDLDPAPEVRFAQVKEAAVELRRLLEAAGLATFLMTTGGKGLHLVAPLGRHHDWSQVKDFAHAVASALTRAAPDLYVDVMSKQRRRNRVFIDYLRNDRGATAIMPFSTRAREGAPVAVPMLWDELDGLDSAAAFDTRSVRTRLQSLHRDPWEGFLRQRQRLRAGAREVLERFKG